MTKKLSTKVSTRRSNKGATRSIAESPTNTTPARPRPELSGDIALVFGRNAEGVHILRRRSEEAPIEAGLLRPMREGKPIQGEVVSLTRRRDLPMLYDVKSEFGAPAEADSRPAADGPAQVASDAYRKGWDAVWGRLRDRGLTRSVN